jgi:hypothetical protein
MNRLLSLLVPCLLSYGYTTPGASAAPAGRKSSSTAIVPAPSAMAAGRTMATGAGKSPRPSSSREVEVGTHVSTHGVGACFHGAGRVKCLGCVWLSL